MFRKKGDQGEVRRGLKAAYPRLWRYCLSLTANRERAEELAQMTCLRALEKASYYAAGTNLNGWIFRIAQRIWLNELRADAVRRSGQLVPSEEIELPDSNTDPERSSFVRQVLREVVALPEAQRTAVMIVYVEGFSYKDAAEILEIPIGTVMSRLAAARARLVYQLGEQGSKVG
ncbi:MAG: RNA polymerase sigma factor [Alphaproteobacteria bacterium]